MATPLFLSSLQLINKLTNPKIFPSVFYYCQRTSSLHANASLYRVFLSNATNLVVLTTGLLPILYLLCTSSFTSDIKGITELIANLIFLGFFLLHFAFLPITLDAINTAKYYNAVLKMGDQNRNAKLRSVTKESFQGFLNKHMQLHNRETKKLLRAVLTNSDADYLGVLVSLFVFYGFILMIVVPPLVVYFDWDPAFLLVTKLLPDIMNISNKNIFKLIRFPFLAIGVFEVNRTNLISATLLLAHQFIYNAITQRILIAKFNAVNLKSFILFRVLANSGNQVIQTVAGTFMGAGFFLGVFCNVFLLIGWQFVPVQLYLTFLPASVFIPSIIGMGISMSIKIHETTSRVIKVNWKLDTMKLWTTGKLLSMRLPKRLINGQRAVSICAFDLATLTKNTRLSYYSYIVKCSTDLILVL